MFEKIFKFSRKEKDLRSRVVSALRESRKDGLLGPEAKGLLEQWLIEEESRVPNTPEGSIGLNLKRAKLYKDAGYLEEALENALAAEEQARYLDNPNIDRAVKAMVSAL